MIVVALIAVAAGVVSLALRDPSTTRLETEGQRLSTLLESARAESRASGLVVQWMPVSVGDESDFRFVRQSGKLSEAMRMPTHWLDPQIRAEVIGAPAVQLGPEPIIGAQRIVLRLGHQQLLLATDGLGPFGVTVEASAP